MCPACFDWVEVLPFTSPDALSFSTDMLLVFVTTSKNGVLNAASQILSIVLVHEICVTGGGLQEASRTLLPDRCDDGDNIRNLKAL